MLTLTPPKVLKTNFNFTATSIAQAGFYKTLGCGDDATHLASANWVKDKLDEESSDEAESDDGEADDAANNEEAELDAQDDDEDEPKAKRLKTEEPDVKIEMEPSDDV